MVELCSPALLFPFVGALASHIIFKRLEPNALHFLLALLAFVQVTMLIQVLNGYSFTAATTTCLSFVGKYLLLLCLSISLYRLSPWHPLARFPGPRLAHLSKWWMVYHIIFRGGRHRILQQLHARHGAWIRMGPNEISVNLPSSIRPIYSRLDRARFYQGAPFSADTLISVLDRQTHKNRRQPWINALNSEALAAYLPVIHSRITQVVETLNRKCTTGEIVSLDYWIYLFFLDTMGDIGFTGGFESMEAEKDTEGWLSTLAMGVFFASSMGQIPWLKDIVNILPRRGPIDTFHRLIDQKIHQIDVSGSQLGRTSILGFLLDSSAEAKLTPGEIQAFKPWVTIFRYLGFDPERQSRLRNEIRTVLSDSEDSGGDATTSEICRLPFLDACVQESLRIVPPGPFGPLRTTGTSGAHVCGEYIPPNTTIHVPVYAMHRDPAFFGVSADRFIPERWINDDPVRQQLGIELPAIDATCFMPFGAGFGSCIGKNLAVQNVKLLVAYIIHNFAITFPPDFDATSFDESYREFGIWQHNPLPVRLSKID